MDSYRPAGRSDRSNGMYEFGRDRRNDDRQSNFSFQMPNQGQGRRAPPRFPEEPRNNAQRNPVERFDDNNRKRKPRHPRKGLAGNAKEDNRGNRPYRGGGRGGRGGRGRFPRTSDRPLLIHERAPTPEQVDGMNEGESRFKNVNDLSDSEEEEMQLDSDNPGKVSDSDQSDAEQPAAKKPRLNHTQSAPKWSNPDPYYLLPPIDETAGKKKDVVKMIRKAKADAGGSSKSAADGEDFISFDFGGDGMQDDEDSDDENDLRGPPPNRFSHLDNLHPDRKKGLQPAEGVQLPSRPAKQNYNVNEPPPPPPDNLRIDTWPPPPPPGQPGAPSSNNTADGKKGRKRGAQELDDDDKGSKKKPGKGPGRKISDIRVKPQWRAKANQDATPWLQVQRSPTKDTAGLLHEEVLQFYNFLKPQQFENTLRERLVSKIQDVLDQILRGAQVHYFGSFAAGLYLPEGDMDLVVLSSSYQRNGYPQLGQRPAELHRFGGMLRNKGMVKDGSMAIIGKARVPLVKFRDKATGLRVDVSFENDSGLRANRTYTEWKAEYPAMSILVTLIKQFLVMRDLCDVHTGGLGGFSISCLVISLVQHMPNVRSGNMDPMQNLGEMLLTFFDYYGNKFDLDRTGIEMSSRRGEPSRLVDKTRDSRMQTQANQGPRLSIVDPNDSGNVISKGSFNILSIFKAFSEAAAALKRRMIEVDYEPATEDTSMLGSLYEGDYQNSYVRQRAHMHRLYTESEKAEAGMRVRGLAQDAEPQQSIKAPSKGPKQQQSHGYEDPPNDRSGAAPQEHNPKHGQSGSHFPDVRTLEQQSTATSSNSRSHAKDFTKSRNPWAGNSRKRPNIGFSALNAQDAQISSLPTPIGPAVTSQSMGRQSSGAMSPSNPPYQQLSFRPGPGNSTAGKTSTGARATEAITLLLRGQSAATGASTNPICLDDDDDEMGTDEVIFVGRS